MRGELDDGVFSTEGESLEGISDAFTAGDEDLTEPSVHDEAITASFRGTAEEPGETAVEDAVSAPSPFRGAADSNAAPAPGDPRPQGGTMSSPTAASSGDDPWLENGAEPADSPSVGSLPPSRTARSAGNGGGAEPWSGAAEAVESGAPWETPAGTGVLGRAGAIAGSTAKERAASALLDSDGADYSDAAVGDARHAAKRARGMKATWDRAVQARARAIRRGVEAGRTMEGMSVGERARAAVRAVANAATASMRSGCIALIGALAPIAAVAAVALFGTLLLTTCTGGTEEVPAGLSENEALVAQYLMDKGLDTVSIAAIMGNIRQESGFDPACRQGGGGPGRGFFQWEEGGSRFAALSTLAASRGVSWEDAACQMDFFWSEADGVFRTYSVMDHVYDTGAHAGLGGYMSFAMWQQIRDIDWATESFERVYTRASRPAMERRIEYARSYLSILEADPSLSQDYASASTAQKAIVDACRQTPSPGGNLCAKWVSQVFDRAGIGYIGGNACDMYDRWCNMSGGSQLKVGMIVAVDSYDLGGSSSAAVAGRIYGHVAIYVGDGQVMENVGSIRTTPLDRWLETYGNVHPVKWGWAMGVDLSQEG